MTTEDQIKAISKIISSEQFPELEKELWEIKRRLESIWLQEYRNEVNGGSRCG